MFIIFKKHVIKQLSAYCLNELSPDESRRVAEHLLRCQRCRKEYEEIKLGVALARCLPRALAPASVWSEIEKEWESGRMEERENGRKGEWASRREGKAILHAPTRPRAHFFIRFMRPRTFALAAMVVLALGIIAWYYTRPPKASWEVARLAGAPRVGSDRIETAGRLAVGEWLETDSASRAKINVGQIGEVEIEPNTRVRLVQARLTEHRLALARGTMHARIWAPPRLFFVETPSAIATDLGCTYTLMVDDAGAGLLHVTSGWVAFELKGRESFVPAGARCETRPGIGPGTPYFEDASEAFREALVILDFEKGNSEARAAALRIVLAESRQHDALTLWHLLSRADEAEREQVYDRLAALVPPPEGVTREGVLRADKHMLDLWWNELGLGDTNWWRLWKGPWSPRTK
ncbi:MAG: zf-HC2 domain-containing protein [Acidobacteria bacterium]|nr:zf-HC2 domain-containing protein [Acidobacteriota bacterium]